MTRRYGRARRGQRVHDAAPENWGRNVTVLGSLSCQGLEAVMTIEGAADAAVFRAYVSEVLAPTLKPGDVVVMDNLGAHKAQGIRSAIKARTRDALDEALAHVIDTVTASDPKGWFTHCGYAFY